MRIHTAAMFTQLAGLVQLPVAMADVIIYTLNGQYTWNTRVFLLLYFDYLGQRLSKARFKMAEGKSWNVLRSFLQIFAFPPERENYLHNIKKDK